MRPAPPLRPPVGVDDCIALLAYDGSARDVVARVKYRNHRAALEGLAAAMAASVTVRPDVVTWAPTTAERRRARGFDHAELLARAVARTLDVPCLRLLRRRPGPPQTGRSLVDRRASPPAFVLTRPAPGHVLLVDDVVTTGATCAAAAATLRRAGSARITVLAAARTPPNANSRRPRSVTMA